MLSALLAIALFHVDVGGLDRTYRVYRPATLSRTRPVPLVVVLHGGLGSGAQAESSYGWDASADRHGFVVAYPDGVSRAWNAGSCCGRAQRSNVDDVGFLTQLVNDVSSSQNVDSHAIAIAGMSNGAMMAYRMACESSLPLRAIGSVSGTMLTACSHPQRTRVIEIHGTADQNIPYAGGAGNGPGGIVTPPIPKVVERWRAIDGCGSPQTSTTGAVTVERAACAQDTSVELISVAGAGHQWPGGKPPPARFAAWMQAFGIVGLDPPSTALDATETLWHFFFGTNDGR